MLSEQQDSQALTNIAFAMFIFSWASSHKCPSNPYILSGGM